MPIVSSDTANARGCAPGVTNDRREKPGCHRPDPNRREHSGRQPAEQQGGEQGNDDRRCAERHQHQPGLACREAVNPDQALRQEDDRNHEAEGQRERQCLHADEPCIAEQVQVEHRLGMPAFDPDKHRKQHREAGEQTERSGAQPAPLRPLEDGEVQHQQRRGKGDGAAPIDAPCRRVERLAHPGNAEGKGDQARNRGRHKGRAPAEMLDQHAREERAKRKANTEAGAQDAIGSRPCMALELAGERSAGSGHGEGCRQSLRAAQQVQRQDIRREGQQRRGRGKQREAPGEGLAAAKTVGKRACGHDRAAEDQDVAADGPAHFDRRGAELGCDGREGDAEPGEAPGHGHPCEAHRDQNEYLRRSR